MPPPSGAARAIENSNVPAPSAPDERALAAFIQSASVELNRYLSSHQVVLGKASTPGLAKRIAILAIYACGQRGLKLEAAIRLAAGGLRLGHNPSTVRKCSSEARALAGQLEAALGARARTLAEIVAAASDLSVDRLVRRRADELLGSKGGRPPRRGAAVEAVVRMIGRAKQGDPLAASELQMIRKILVVQARR